MVIFRKINLYGSGQGNPGWKGFVCTAAGGYLYISGWTHALQGSLHDPLGGWSWPPGGPDKALSGAIVGPSEGQLGPSGVRSLTLPGTCGGPQVGEEGPLRWAKLPPWWAPGRPLVGANRPSRAPSWTLWRTFIHPPAYHCPPSGVPPSTRRRT